MFKSGNQVEAVLISQIYFAAYSGLENMKIFFDPQFFYVSFTVGTVLSVLVYSMNE